jgi:hypothetical protein
MCGIILIYNAATQKKNGPVSRSNLRNTGNKGGKKLPDIGEASFVLDNLKYVD